jgi:hypothetical protein
VTYDYALHDAQIVDNLNRVVIHNADGPDVPLRSNRGESCSAAAPVEAVFDAMEDRLCAMIDRFPVVVGCMAWLTNEKVLTTLQGRETVSIVVNKEDFLRPDRGTWSQQQIRKLYGLIPGFCRGIAGREYSYASDEEADAVRCVGISADRREVPPRMHHKFFVFCNYQTTEWQPSYLPWGGEFVPTDNPYVENDDTSMSRKAVPVAVWTGSFNATFNGTQSLENAVIITDPTIARSYTFLLR